MAFEINPNIYKITQGVIYVGPNAHEDVNLIAMRCDGKVVIEAYSPVDGIKSKDLNTFMSWDMSARNVKINNVDNSEQCYLYARLLRNASVGEFIFSKNRYNIDGSMYGDPSSTPSEVYFYILFAILSGVNEDGYRELSYNYGALGSSVSQTQVSTEINNTILPGIRDLQTEARELGSTRYITTTDKKSLNITRSDVYNNWELLYNEAHGVVDEHILTSYEASAKAFLAMYAYILGDYGENIKTGTVDLGPIDTLHGPRRLAVKYSEGIEVIDGVPYGQYDVGYTDFETMSRQGWADFYQSYDFYVKSRAMVEEELRSVSNTSRSLIKTETENKFELKVNEVDGKKYIQLVSNGKVVSEVNVDDIV